MRDKPKTSTFETPDITYKVMPRTMDRLQAEPRLRQSKAQNKAKVAGEAAGSGDGWHSSTYRILQDEMWVLADHQAQIQRMINNSTLMEVPTQVDIVQQGHVVKLKLKGELKDDYGLTHLWVHLVSEPDKLFLDSVLKSKAEFDEHNGGQHILLSVNTPMARSILGKRRGESITFEGGHGDVFEETITNEEQSIMVSHIIDENYFGEP